MLLVMAIGVLVCLKAASTGLPRVLVDRLEECLSGEDFAVALEDVRFSPFGSASVDEVCFFEKGHAHHAMRLSGVRVRYRWGWNGYPIPRPVRLDVRKADIAALPFLSDDDEPSTASTDDRLPVAEADVSIRALRFLGTAAGRVRIHLRSDGRRLDFSNIHADISEPGAPPQVVRGDLTMEVSAPRAWPGRPPRPRTILAGRLSGQLVPATLNPTLERFGSESLPQIFSGFEFPVDPPRCDVLIEIREDRRRITTDITAGRCLYNGVPILRLAGVVEVDGDADDWTDVTVRGLEVARPEGHATGNLHFDFRRHGMELDATSTLDFAHLAKIADILPSVPWDSYETTGGNTATASGFIAFEEATEPSRLRGRLSAGAFSFRRRVPARNLAADLSIDGDDIRFSGIRATVYDGNFSASVRLWLDPDTDHQMLAVTSTVERASVGLINHDLFGGLEDDPGRADACLDAILDTDAEDPLRTATGNFSAKVRDARLFRTPLFAGFTDFLARNVPGVDLLVTQDDLDAKAVISDNGLHIRELRIEGPLLSVQGEGAYWFSDYLDLGVRVHLFRHRTIVGKTLRVLLYPVSKLFEMEATGPLRNPEWSPTTLTLSGRGKPTNEQKYGSDGGAAGATSTAGGAETGGAP